MCLVCQPVCDCRGVVVTLECVEKLIRKDMIDPVSGQTLKEKDIIVLQRVCLCVLYIILYTLVPLSNNTNL